MPRYFFDIRDKDGDLRDTEGLVLANMDEAVLEARRTLVEMVRDTVREPGTNGIAIRIRDGLEGPMLVTVTLESHLDDDETPPSQHM